MEPSSVNATSAQALLAQAAWALDGWEILKFVAAGAAGYLGKAIYDFWQKRREQPVIECELFHFDFAEALGEFMSVNLPLLGDDGKPVDAAIILHRMRVRGGKPIKNVQIEVRAGDGNEIVAHCFYVDQRVICDRLKTVHDDKHKLRCEWSYFNPNDLVELELVIGPCVDPTKIAIDVDAEGVIVKNELGRLNCLAKYSERLNIIDKAKESLAGPTKDSAKA